jgi:hypothetical protein
MRTRDVHLKGSRATSLSSGYQFAPIQQGGEQAVLISAFIRKALEEALKADNVKKATDHHHHHYHHHLSCMREGHDVF